MQDRPPRRSAAIIVLPLQLFLAAGWARAGVEKLIDTAWWNGDKLSAFLDEQRNHMLPFFVWFSDHAVAPWPTVIAFVVAEAQLAIAICLLTNRYVKPALWAAIALNVAFTMAGAVNPSAFYLVMQLTILFALSRPVPLQIAVRRAALFAVPAVVVLPFARTLDPALVIDDPALMLSFVSGLAAVATLAPWRWELLARMSERMGRRRSERPAATFRERAARVAARSETPPREPIG